MKQKLESINDLVDLAPTLDYAELYPVYFSNGDESRFKVIKNSTIDSEVCTVSNRYQLLQHRDAVNYILSGIQAIGIEGSGTLRNYHDSVVVETYFDNLSIRDNSQDGNINLGMRFTNSFNKTKGFNGVLFGHRQVCENGMIMNKMIPNAPKLSIRHLGDITTNITDTIHKFIENIFRMENAVIEIIDSTKNSIISFQNNDTQLEFFKSVVGSQERAELITSVNSIELETTQWDIYNALTSFVSHSDDLSYTQYNNIHNKAQDFLISPRTTIQNQIEDLHHQLAAVA